MSAQLLIVDDEEEIRALLRRHFTLSGYHVRCAADGGEALELLQQQRYEVVISDIIMPGMGGIELLGRIRQDYPMVQVVMITGHVTLFNALACMRQGALTCVFKPLVDLTELEQAVECGLARLRDWQVKLRRLRGLCAIEGPADE